MNRIFWRYLAPVLTLMWVSGFLAFVRGCAKYSGPAPVSHIRQVASQTGLVFPPDAVLVDGQVHQTLASGGSIIAKVEMKRSDITRFVAQSPFHGKVASDKAARDHFIAQLPAHLTSRWRLTAIRHCWTTGGAYLEEPYVGALLDLDSPTQASVYVWSYN